jgi:hypothetical protein
MKKIYFSLIGIFAITFLAYSQDDLSDIVNNNSDQNVKEYATATFKAFKIINAQTNETAKKRNLHFNIAHRFGDVGGPSGGIHSFFGLDGAPDIRWSFDYGVTDRLQLGVGRSKGIEPYKELYDGNIKYRLLRQTTNGSMPLSITMYGVAGITGRKSSTDSTAVTYYEGNFSYRMSYVTQAIIARKFSSSFSMELIPSWCHRNYVEFEDENDLFSIGAGARMKVSKRFAIIADYFHTFGNYRANSTGTDGSKIYYDPLSIGVEIETGGHVFALTFTNATGILENSFIPETQSNWADGEFRWGFNITRNFTIGGNK